jgi:aminopeptidase N
MSLLSVALLVAAAQAPPSPQPTLDALRRAIGGASESALREQFTQPAHADYVLGMARRRGGLGRIGATVIPTPPGWESTGPYWAIFHTDQDIQQDWNPVHPLVLTPEGYRLGAEIPEMAAEHSRIRHADLHVLLDPPKNFAAIGAGLHFHPPTLRRAAILRMNESYVVRSASADGSTLDVVRATSEGVAAPKEGSLLQAGGLLIPWRIDPPQSLHLRYDVTVDTRAGDRINPNAAYLTAWWVPSTARLPHTTRTTIEGPADWELRSEGILEGEPERSGDRQTVTYRCDLPISYPKVVAGRYLLAAKLERDGKLFRAYHLLEKDEERGRKEVEAAANAVVFFEKNLVPFPFPGYDVFDSDTYYGIESYSYTLLRRDVTVKFVSHEIGHTYFGGITPSAYVRDTWNEGVTQYLDSVLFLENADRSLEAGLRTVNLRRPLSGMNVAWEHGSASYYRGAYVMRMLEHEIGREAVLEGLRAMLKDRVGRPTVWADLRRYFEASSGRSLDWFWDQWIDGDTFPRVEVVQAQRDPDPRGQNWRTRVVVRQSGTLRPFRMKLRVRVGAGGQFDEQIVELRSPEAGFSISTTFQPVVADVQAFDVTLATVGREARVTR